MPRIMYDSVNWDAIPANAEMVAGYIDGTTYKWPESAWKRFPHAVKVRIARRTFTNDGHVLDVEPGIPTVWPPTQAIVDWVKMRRAAGVEPTVYCNQLNDWANIRARFRQANVREPNWWVARYNNVRDLPTGAIAKQFANPPLAGGHYDLSIVADYWPGVDGQSREDDNVQMNEVVEFLEQNSAQAFGHGVHGGDWFQDFRLEVRETRSAILRFEAVANQLLQRMADGEIIIRPRQDPPGEEA